MPRTYYYRNLAFAFNRDSRYVTIRYSVANVSAVSIELTLYVDNVPELPDTPTDTAIFTAPNPYHPAIDVHMPTAQRIARACDDVINALRESTPLLDCDPRVPAILIDEYDANPLDTAILTELD